MCLIEDSKFLLAILEDENNYKKEIIEIDCNNNYLNSIALGIVLNISNKFKDSYIKLINVTPALKKVLKILGIHNIPNIIIGE